ncbi:MAG: hypothetical protein MKZ95_18135 [Pirellulales bacterium]|nr:hypothetical protein [Pirellulales bacterium]
MADVDSQANEGETEPIKIEHISEAINYRMLDRQFWS